MLTDLIVIGAKPRLSFVIPSRDAAMLAPTPPLGFLIPEKRGLTSRPIRWFRRFQEKKAGTAPPDAALLVGT